MCIRDRHEAGQRRERRVDVIDPLLEPGHLGRGDAQRAFDPVRSGEIGAKVEQVVLDPQQHRVDQLRLPAEVYPRHADGGVGLVHVAVGGDAQGVFGDALARAERRRAGVAAARIDFVQYDHEPFPGPQRPV